MVVKYSQPQLNVDSSSNFSQQWSALVKDDQQWPSLDKRANGSHNFAADV